MLLMDAELYKLRHYQRKSPTALPLNLTQQVRLSMLDGWLETIDAILEDRRLHRYNSHVIGSIWEVEKDE